MGFSQIIHQLSVQWSLLGQKISKFFKFVFNKLNNFKNLTLNEQIAYGVIFLGIFLILLSIIMFMF